MKGTGWVRLVACATALGAGGLCEAALGEEAARSSEVEEITVTAQKREERLQTAPVSVTALTGESIAEAGISTVVDVAQFTPNLSIHPNAGGNTGSTVNIRGAITSDPIITLEPAVGIYVDGVYVGKSVGSAFDFADLDRIEVLRGPQGTLYGRNTIGGAINLVSTRPSDRLEARTRNIAGNYDSYENVTTFNAPVIGENGFAEVEGLGQINTRASLSYRLRDQGFFENDGTGSRDFDNLNRFGTRMALRWQPIDRITLDYDFDFHRAREDTSAFQLTHVRRTPDPVCPLVNTPGGPVHFCPTEFLAPFAHANRQDSIANNSVLQLDGSREDLENDLDVRGHAIAISGDIGEAGPLGELTVKSITGFRSLDQYEVQDLDGTSISVADFSLRADHEQRSEEIQLLGQAWEKRIHYTVGFYFLDEEGGEDNDQVILGDSPFPTRIDSVNRFDNQSYAPFGQVTVTPPILDDRLSLTAGIRYTYEKKDQRRRFDCLTSSGQDPCFGVDLDGDGTPDFDAADFREQADKSFDDVSPMGNVAFQWTEELMTYGRIARGFKSGGFNGRATAAALFANPYKDEKLTSYELGFKSQWLDNRLRVNGAGFFNDYEDLQVTVFRFDNQLGPVTTLENAAEAEIWGAELELTAVPLTGVDVRVGYGLLLPEYKRFVEDCPMGDPRCAPGTEIDVSGERDFVLSPEHTVTAGILYTLPPTRHGVYSIGIDSYYQDSVKFAVALNDDNDQVGYVLFNTRAQVTSVPLEHGYLDLALFCRNLFDKKYKDFGIDFGELGYAGNTYGDPRTFGVEFGYRWGAES